jgi:transposase
VTSQIIYVFEGRDAADLDRWLQTQPPEWRHTVHVVSLDPHEGYRKALTDSPYLVDDLTLVVDPFHIVKLANTALTKCRQRTQQGTLGHRGRTGDALYGTRKLMLMAAEHLDEQGWERINDALRQGDPHGEVQDAWVAKEFVRDIYLAHDRTAAATALTKAITWCVDSESGPELVTLGKTLQRWTPEILAHHDTGASNGRVEAANLLIKNVKRAGRGYRNQTNCRLRILLAGGQTNKTHHVTKLRPKPRLIA